MEGFVYEVQKAFMDTKSNRLPLRWGINIVPLYFWKALKHRTTDLILKHFFFPQSFSHPKDLVTSYQDLVFSFFLHDVHLYSKVVSDMAVTHKLNYLCYSVHFQYQFVAKLMITALNNSLLCWNN